MSFCRVLFTSSLFPFHSFLSFFSLLNWKSTKTRKSNTERLKKRDSENNRSISCLMKYCNWIYRLELYRGRENLSNCCWNFLFLLSSYSLRLLFVFVFFTSFLNLTQVSILGEQPVSSLSFSQSQVFKVFNSLFHRKYWELFVKMKIDKNDSCCQNMLIKHIIWCLSNDHLSLLHDILFP